MNDELMQEIDDVNLAQLAVDLYLQGLAREAILKKLMERARDPKKCERICKALAKTIRINKEINGRYDRYRLERSQKERSDLKRSSRSSEQAQQEKRRNERNMDDDDYCPPIY